MTPDVGSAAEPRRAASARDDFRRGALPLDRQEPALAPLHIGPGA